MSYCLVACLGVNPFNWVFYLQNVTLVKKLYIAIDFLGNIDLQQDTVSTGEGHT